LEQFTSDDDDPSYFNADKAVLYQLWRQLVSARASYVESEFSAFD